MNGDVHRARKQLRFGSCLHPHGPARLRHRQSLRYPRRDVVPVGGVRDSQLSRRLFNKPTLPKKVIDTGYLLGIVDLVQVSVFEALVLK